MPFDQDPVTSFPRDPEKFAKDLAATTQELLEDPEKCRRFGDAGRKARRGYFQLDGDCASDHRVVQRLIEQKKSTK